MVLPPHNRSAPATAVAYRERLSVPRWWHALAPLVAVILGGEALLTDRPGVALGVITGFWVLAELVLVSIGRHEVSVLGHRVRAGNWRLPIGAVRGVAPLDAAAMRIEQRRRDPNVYRCTAPWISTGVLLDVDDPDDLPLWLVSTRHPDVFMQNLAAADGESSDARP